MASDVSASVDRRGCAGVEARDESLEIASELGIDGRGSQGSTRAGASGAELRRKRAQRTPLPLGCSNSRAQAVS